VDLDKAENKIKENNELAIPSIAAAPAAPATAPAATPSSTGTATPGLLS
jgi:hypothetical protein